MNVPQASGTYHSRNTTHFALGLTHGTRRRPHDRSGRISALLGNLLGAAVLVAACGFSALQGRTAHAAATGPAIPFIKRFDGLQNSWTARPSQSPPQLRLQWAEVELPSGPLVLSQSEVLELRFPEGNSPTIRERLDTPETESIPFNQLTRAGFGQASFIVRSPWITMRYLGERPAGFQLSGPEFSEAAIQALGSPNDVLPVTTAAQAVHDMMETYFAPLLGSLPNGKTVMAGLHVQGAYFSTTYNPPDDFRLDFDNAFIVGLQTLVVYPSSCFQRPDPSQCTPPYLSTGHDPTVIGHELGHVIFNRIRAARSLKGYQWFAVNEGYADYFSASYHETPLIGETWQSSRLRAPYLRRLTDDPTTRDPEVLASAHAFSVVWSSLLWRIRTALIETDPSSRSAFDRAVLLSIAHLGEGGGNRLGDAATALLKAVHESGHSEWDAVLRAEFSRAGVELVAENLALAPEQPHEPGTTDPQETQNRRQGFGCSAQAAVTGVSTNPLDDRRNELPDLALFILASALLRALQRKGVCTPRRQRDTKPSSATFGLCAAPRVAVGLSTLLSTACVRQPEPKTVRQLIQLRGPALVYRCNLAFFGGSGGSTDISAIEINWPTADKSTRDLVGVIFDAQTADPASALQVHVDAELRRIDRFLGLEGKPIENQLTPTAVTETKVQQLALMALALAVLEEAPRARSNQNGRNAVEKSTNSDLVTFLHRDRWTLTADFSSAVTGPGAYGPLPASLKETERQVCTLVKE